MAKSRQTGFSHGLPMILLISILYPLGPAAVILAPLIVGGVIDEYGFTDAQAGLIASMDGLGLVIGLLAGALWVRKVSWPRMLFLGLAAYAAANALSATTGTAGALVAMRLLCGFCGGSVFAIINAALGDNRQPDRAFGIAQAVQGVMMFAAFASVPLMAEGRLVNSLFFMLAGASVVLMLCVLRFPHKGVARTAAGPGAAGQAGRLGLIWIGLAGGLLYYASVFGFWAWIERVGVNAGLAGGAVEFALSVSQIAAVAGGIAAGLAGDRFGRVAPLACAAAGQLLVLWLLLGQFSAATYLIGACLYQGLYIIATSYLLGVIARLDQSGRYVVVMNGVLGIGASLGPSIAAALIRPGDYSGLNFAAAAGIALTLALFLFVIHRSRAVTNRRSPS